MKRKDWINILILVVIYLCLVGLILGKDHVFGSTLDWFDQHFNFADYFRNLFYETKQLIPSFAFNIGAGQNIFNFSYYGLLSPLILISYLLPMVKMAYYVMGMIILTICVAIILIYYWLHNHFDSKLSFLGAIIFIGASPILFHSHRHIMFVNYMPFLMLSLIGTDRYFKNKKSDMLIISIFLTIMTSYYYSVGSIIAIIVYAVYLYLESSKDFIFKDFFKSMILFGIRILIAVLMASIILLPTLYTLFSGRASTSTSINILSLFIPSLNFDFYLYETYSMGLTSIFIYAFFSLLFTKEKKNRFLGFIFIIMLLFKFFTYMLNGTMYIDAKALIPFIPIAILTILLFLQRIFNKIEKKELLVLFVPFLLLIFKIVIKGGKYYFLSLDAILILLSILIIYKYKKKFCLYTLIIILSLGTTYIASKNDTLVTKKEMVDLYDKSYYDKVNSIINADGTFYRIGEQLRKNENMNLIYSNEYYQGTVYSSVSNSFYNDFYFNLIGNEISHRNTAITDHPNNILFDTLMGFKYLITKNPPIGYEKIGDNLYINKNVYPIGYLTDKKLSSSIYQDLEFPYNSLALLDYVIYDNDVINYESDIESFELNYESAFKNVDIRKEDKSYIIDASKDNLVTLKLDNAIDGKILFISFNMDYNQSCTDGDTWIKINNVKNKLTCKEWKYHNHNYKFKYTISSPDPIEELKVVFANGHYEISNIKIYSLDYEKLIDIQNSIDNLIIDRDKTIGDNIIGSINASKDGILILTIPFDKGFNVYIDGVKTDYFRVNEAFIGINLNEGEHNVKIIYKSPLLKAGKIMSVVGMSLFVLFMILERKGSKDEENS